MRGHPLLQLILVVVAFALAGIPVWRLTRPAGAVPPVVAELPRPEIPAAPLATMLTVRVSFVPAPAEFELKALGTTLLQGRGPQADFAGEIKTDLSKDGVDFTLAATWTDPVPLHAAAHVSITFPDGHTIDRALWSEAGAPLAEVITVTP